MTESSSEEQETEEHESNKNKWKTKTKKGKTRIDKPHSQQKQRKKKENFANEQEIARESHKDTEEEEPHNAGEETQREGEPQREPRSLAEAHSRTQTDLMKLMFSVLQETKNKKLVNNTIKKMEEMTELNVRIMEEAAFGRGKVEGLEIAVKALTEENSYLREELERAKGNKPMGASRATYSEILSSTPQLTTGDHTKASTIQMEPPKTKSEDEGLIIYVKDPSIRDPTRTIDAMLKKEFTLPELGMKSVTLKPVRGGLIVLSKNKEGLQTLQDKLANHPNTATKFETKRTTKKNPQISVTDIDINMSEEEVIDKIIEQNDITGTSNDFKVIMTFNNREDKTLIMEVTPPLFGQIQGMEKLFIGWTTCRVRENIHTPRCTTCCTYGHTSRSCRANPRCSECSGSHPSTQCRGGYDEAGNILPSRCPACSDRNRRDEKSLDTEHSFYNRTCPVLALERERAQARINYQLN